MACLGFLIVVAMLLVNVVMLKFEERDLVEAKLETGRLLLHVLSRQVGNKIGNDQKGWDKLISDRGFKEELRQLIRIGGFSDALIVETGGNKVYDTGPWVTGFRSVKAPSSYESTVSGKKSVPTAGEAEKNALALSAKVLQIRKWAFDFYGSSWGVIWPAYERVNMSFPLFVKGRLMGAVAISGHLGSLYASLRESQKTILIYIALNTLILVLFGVFLLSRTVIKPIYKLLSITDRFKEGEPLPTFGDSPRNEIGQLFRSLNMMFRRLEENKKELKKHIFSLEKANQEIKKAQREIIRSEKAASVGRLATGVAHEMGNPIGIVLGYLELIKGEDLEEGERRDFEDRIESELMRINRIIKQLLDFSRPSTGQRTTGSIHQMIRETVSIVRPQPMMAHMNIEMALDAARDTVWAESDQLKQVFLNIIINSADAMQGEEPLNDVKIGTLNIRTQDKDESIEIRFRDTGKGIPKKELSHIFDPFFTTKEPGKGTGLGLSVSCRIIEEMGGDIRAESLSGEGTTVIINIPLQQEGKPEN